MCQIGPPFCFAYCCQTPFPLQNSFSQCLVINIMTFVFAPLGISGVDPWVDRGHFPPLFQVEGTPCVLAPYFFGGRRFCTTAHGIRRTIGAIFVKFSQLIFMKIIVTTRCQILRLKCAKFNFRELTALPQIPSWI